jgi:orotate phosphoribosyltransferase-like protein
MNDLVNLYTDGLTIKDIGEELWWDEESVLFLLRQMKKKDTNGKNYVYEFKEMVVERIQSGVIKGQVTKELGIAYRTINKYLDEFNVEIPKNKQEQENNMFSEIDWKDFSICPECKGKHVNDLNLYREDGVNQRNSYCLDCGTEWLEKWGKVYKVLWEFVR